MEWPHQNPEALARLGSSPPAGVLLYGQPGCSKTLLARAVAAEARSKDLHVIKYPLYTNSGHDKWTPREICKWKNTLPVNLWP